MKKSRKALGKAIHRRFSFTYGTGLSAKAVGEGSFAFRKCIRLISHQAVYII